jgi:hypothetical protein
MKWMLWKDGVGMAEFGMTRVRIGLFQHAFPKDVIVRGVLHKEGTVGRLVGEQTAVRKPNRTNWWTGGWRRSSICAGPDAPLDDSEKLCQGYALVATDRIMTLTIPRLAVNSQIRAAADNRPPLKIGSTGEGVCILQQALIDLGFKMPHSTHGGDSLPDGIFGVETDQVVKKFQRGNALNPDGAVGRLTLKRLEEELIADSDRRKAQTQAGIRLSIPIG